MLLAQRYRPALAELEQFAQETGIPAVQTTLAHQLESVKQAWNSDMLAIQLVYYGQPTPTETETLLKTLLPDWSDAPADFLTHHKDVLLQVKGVPITLTIRSWEEAMSEVGHGQRPLLVLAVLFDSATGLDDRWPHLESLATDVPATLLLGSDALMRETRPSVARLQTNALEVEVLRWEALQPNTGLLSAWLTRLGPERVDILRAQGILGALEDADRVFQMVLRTEEKNLKAKRQLSQQQLAKVQNRAGSQQSGELLSLIKTNLQNQFTLFEKGVNEQLDKAFKPNIGTFGKEVDELLGQLSRLDEVIRSKTTELKIPTDIDQQFMHLHRDKLMQLGLRDLRAMKDLFELAMAEVERQFQSRSVPFTSVHLRFATVEPLENIVQSVVYAERPYRGEQLRKGPYEYFMAARKYQMLMMMTASTLGLSFLTRYKQYMVPLTILLIGMGGYNVWESVKKERIENGEKELQKARETLKGESKRITTDFARQWSRYAGDYLKEQYNQLLLQLETSLKNQLQKMQTDEEDEKRKLQRIMVGMEGTERRLENVIRNRANWERNLSRAKSDLRAQYVNAAKQTTRKPA